MKASLSHLMLAGALLLITGAGYAFLLLDTKRIEQEAVALATEIETKTRQHERAGSNRAALSEVEAEEALIMSHFVPQEDIVSYLETLEETGAAFGARVSVLSVGDPASDGKIALSVSINGSFDAVMRTVGVIEHGQKASVVHSLTLDGNGEGAWSAALTFTTLSPLP
jgi:hypothetical protein